MSTPIWYVKVPSGLDLPDEGPFHLLEEERDEMLEFREDIEVLGAFMDGEWNEDDFPGWDRYRMAPDDLITLFPQEQYWVVTEQVIKYLEGLIPQARSFDNDREGAWKREPGVPDVVVGFALGAMPLAERLQILVASARQGLSELKPGERLIIAAGF